MEHIEAMPFHLVKGELIVEVPFVGYVNLLEIVYGS